MTYQQLDLIFPYFVFAYGAMVSFVLSSKPLMRIAEERLPGPLLSQFTGHRVLAMLCLWVGTLWILQNLWVA